MVAACVERRLAAIMAADVVGYSRLMEADEAGTFARLKRLRTEVVEPIVAQHGGRVVDLKGDGAIVEFQSAVDAVEAAVAAQRAMLDQDADLPEDRRIRFRVGINLGDVIVDAGTIYGDGVNVAARIESLCEPGGVWLSRSVYNQVKGKLDLGFAPSGLHQVKNIGEAVETFRVALDGVAPAKVATGRRRAWHRPALAAAGVLFTLLVATGVWRFWPVEPPLEKPGIAVLPFDNYGDDEATGRLADGITEDIVTDLVRFRDLNVIPRNSTEAYKGKTVDVRQVGRELGVGYVLEGSIQRAADRVRVTAQLIDASDGSHVWADRLDRPVDDLFVAQDELAERVASSVGGYGSVAESGRAVAKRKRPEDLSAYELYLLGIEHKHRLNQADVEEARRLFDAAIAKDPKLARAYVGRAFTDIILTVYGPPYDFVSGVAAMEKDARAAIALDPQDAEAHAVLGEALYNQARFAESTAEYDRALQLNPSSADIAAYASILANLGQPERAATLADKALRLNPNYPAFYPLYVGAAYFFAGRPNDAARILERIPPDQRSEYSLVPLAGALAELGERQKAAAAAADVLALSPAWNVETALATTWLLPREQERQLLIAASRKAGLPICASATSVDALAAKDRLPECDAQRAKALAAKS